MARCAGRGLQAGSVLGVGIRLECQDMQCRAVAGLTAAIRRYSVLQQHSPARQTGNSAPLHCRYTQLVLHAVSCRSLCGATPWCCCMHHYQHPHCAVDQLHVHRVIAWCRACAAIIQSHTDVTTVTASCCACCVTGKARHTSMNTICITQYEAARLYQAGLSS
jgi:hypothetical protein